MLKKYADNIKRYIYSNKPLRKRANRYYVQSLFGSFLRAVLFICLAFIILYPFFAYISNSFKSIEDLTDITVNFIPKNFSVDVIRVAINAMDFRQSFINSVRLTLMISAAQVVSAAVIGYGFGRFQFPGRNILFAFVVISLLVPVQTIIIPEFFKFRYFDFFGIINRLTGSPLNLINTPFSFALLSLTGFGLKNGFYIYLMSQIYAKLPKELDESAMIDGAGGWRTFLSIMLPNSTPMLATVFLFSFSWQWTDTYFSNILLTDYKVLPSAASAVLTYQVNIIDFVVRDAAANAAILIVIAPLVIIYCFAQKLFIQGIESTGIVG